MTSPFFTVLPGHDLAYNEIVKPSRRWAFSYYFLYRWLPLLHPQQAMLVQVLRQSSWQNGKPTGRCQLANATLCRLMGWSESSHKTLLAELDRPLSDWFVRRERTRKRHVTDGHAVEGAPRYRLLMDEPLTPQDQAALVALLQAQRPASPYEAAEQLAHLATLRSRELWERLDRQPTPATLPSRPRSVAELAEQAWPHLDPAALAGSRPFLESAERCQLRITGAGYAHMEMDYLLRSWLPHLGVNQTWLLIALRARCFHDPATSETRDVVVLSRRELEGQLGIPTRTFRRLLREESSLPLFHISPAGEPVDPENPRILPHRGDLAFHVAYPLLPVCPTDLPEYEALLLHRPAEPEDAPFSTGGQGTRLEAANRPGSSAGTIHRRPGNPARSGQPTRLSRGKAAREPGSMRPANPAEMQESGQPTRLDPASEPNILLPVQHNHLESKTATTPRSPLGRGGDSDDRIAEIRRLLDPYGIKGLARILQNPALTVGEVRGWIYRGERQVSAAQMGGYLFRRLQGEAALTELDPLPDSFLRAGEVNQEEAVLFEDWWRDELSPPPFDDGGQRARYGAWLQVVKQEAGDPDRPDYSPHACWRREMARLDVYSR